MIGIMRFLGVSAALITVCVGVPSVSAKELTPLMVPSELPPTEEPAPIGEGRAKVFSETYGRGVEQYKLGAYASAIEAFQAAHAIRPQPRLLFNIAQCYRKLDALDDSIGYFEKYLQADPDTSPEVRAEVQAYLSELRAKQHARAVAQQTSRVIVIAKEKPAPRAYLPLGVVSGVLGLGGLAVGGAFIGINGTCADVPTPPALECARLYNSLTPGIVLTAVGGSLAVIGTVFISLSVRRPKVEQKSIVSQPSDLLSSGLR